MSIVKKPIWGKVKFEPMKSRSSKLKNSSEKNSKSWI